jgi:phosphoribosyl 1,2-cyclic phosphodiesterase
MKIQCFGSRGSIAVSGPEYLKYGGDTTCILIEAGSGHKVIIDAGTGIRRLGNQLVSESQDEIAIIFTHGHWDHLLGLPFFKPLYMKRFHLDLYGVKLSNGMGIQATLQGIFTHPYFPVGLDAIKAKLHYHPVPVEPFVIGSLRIIPVAINHPDGGVGYRVEENGKSFVFLTDNELSDVKHNPDKPIVDFVSACSGADLLIHDAEFLPSEFSSRRGWGHSSYDKTVELALNANVKMLGLFHHNQDRTDEGVDAIVSAASDLIKQAGSNILCVGIGSGFEIAL